MNQRKSKYISPTILCLPCTSGHLLAESDLPFDPEQGTEEALSKEFNQSEFEFVDEMHYEIGQKGGNWYDSIDGWRK